MIRMRDVIRMSDQSSGLKGVITITSLNEPDYTLSMMLENAPRHTVEMMRQFLWASHSVTFERDWTET